MELTLIFAKKLEIGVAARSDWCRERANDELFLVQSLEGRKQLASGWSDRWCAEGVHITRRG